MPILDLLNKDNYVNPITASKRLKICHSCPKLLPITKQCRLCGCFVSLKIKLNTENCPLEKW